MALTSHVFPQFQQGAMTKLMSLNGVDTLKVALGNAAGPIGLATAGIQAAKLLTDWTAIVPEITGTGYTAGGLTLAGVSVVTSGNVTTLTATTPVWGGSNTFTANQAVWYDSTAATIQLIAFWDFGGAVSTTASTYTLTISGTGIYTCTAT